MWNSDFGMCMSQKAAVYTYNDVFYNNKTDIKNTYLKEIMTSLSVSLTPVFGDAYDLLCSLYGRDIFTDDSLSKFEKGLGFICLGKIAKLDNITDASKLAKYLPKGIKHVDTAVTFASKYGDEFISVLNKFDGNKADEVLKLCDKFGDSFVTILLKYSDEGVDLLVSKHGREAIDLIGKLGKEGIEGLKYNDELLGTLTKLDDLENLSDAEKIAKLEKFSKESETLAETLKCKTGFTEGNYLAAMKKSFGFSSSKKLGDAVQAHHLFPVEFFGKGKPYEKLLTEVGIDFCDPRLIVWWDKSTHAKNIVNYSKDITAAISKSGNDVTKLINNVREVAKKYGFEVKF